jgi:hypothetical protein
MDGELPAECQDLVSEAAPRDEFSAPGESVVSQSLEDCASPDAAQSAHQWSHAQAEVGDQIEAVATDPSEVEHSSVGIDNVEAISQSTPEEAVRIEKLEVASEPVPNELSALAEAFGTTSSVDCIAQNEGQPAPSTPEEAVRIEKLEVASEPVPNELSALAEAFGTTSSVDCTAQNEGQPAHLQCASQSGVSQATSGLEEGVCRQPEREANQPHADMEVNVMTAAEDTLPKGNAILAPASRYDEDVDMVDMSNSIPMTHPGEVDVVPMLTPNQTSVGNEEDDVVENIATQQYGEVLMAPPCLARMNLSPVTEEIATQQYRDSEHATAVPVPPAPQLTSEKCDLLSGDARENVASCVELENIATQHYNDFEIRNEPSMSSCPSPTNTKETVESCSVMEDCATQHYADMEADVPMQTQQSDESKLGISGSMPPPPRPLHAKERKGSCAEVEDVTLPNDNATSANAFRHEGDVDMVDPSKSVPMTHPGEGDSLVPMPPPNQTIAGNEEDDVVENIATQRYADLEIDAPMQSPSDVGGVGSCVVTGESGTAVLMFAPPQLLHENYRPDSFPDSEDIATQHYVHLDTGIGAQEKNSIPAVDIMATQQYADIADSRGSSEMPPPPRPSAHYLSSKVNFLCQEEATMQKTGAEQPAVAEDVAPTQCYAGAAQVCGKPEVSAPSSSTKAVIAEEDCATQPCNAIQFSPFSGALIVPDDAGSSDDDHDVANARHNAQSKQQGRGRASTQSRVRGSGRGSKALVDSPKWSSHPRPAVASPAVSALKRPAAAPTIMDQLASTPAAANPRKRPHPSIKEAVSTPKRRICGKQSAAAAGYTSSRRTPVKEASSSSGGIRGCPKNLDVKTYTSKDSAMPDTSAHAANPFDEDDDDDDPDAAVVWLREARPDDFARPQAPTH